MHKVELCALLEDADNAARRISLRIAIRVLLVLLYTPFNWDNGEEREAVADHSSADYGCGDFNVISLVSIC